MSTYKLLRVSTGEEIIFTVKDETPTAYIASKPIALLLFHKVSNTGCNCFRTALLTLKAIK